MEETPYKAAAAAAAVAIAQLEDFEHSTARRKSLESKFAVPDKQLAEMIEAGQGRMKLPIAESVVCSQAKLHHIVQPVTVAVIAIVAIVVVAAAEAKEEPTKPHREGVEIGDLLG